ncbi:MAG: RNA-processing protein, partial [Candidatus Altiarchaeales archaeon]
MVQAVSLGFDLEDAKDLFEVTDIKIINLKNYLSSKKAIIRQKSRIIGRKGLAKKKIEELGKCKIRIKGSKIGIIAKTEDIDRV